ncbi:hypothetical protein [Kribbella speibonae]|uniref:Uncharacterized protein n=1 Tax=Kribbella speibonae TaxID=1572660 RepID=A0A4R0INR9_9ACTN|nr:hypothetical protein [Kribbella speibonae]TCC35303.1 hypothetical protein E0H92_21295 [Kribbella speibonae]
MTNQSEKVGTAASISTRYTCVGLADQVTILSRIARSKMSWSLPADGRRPIVPVSGGVLAADSTDIGGLPRSMSTRRGAKSLPRPDRDP